MASWRRQPRAKMSSWRAWRKVGGNWRGMNCRAAIEMAKYLVMAHLYLMKYAARQISLYLHSRRGLTLTCCTLWRWQAKGSSLPQPWLKASADYRFPAFKGMAAKLAAGGLKLAACSQPANTAASATASKANQPLRHQTVDASESGARVAEKAKG